MKHTCFIHLHHFLIIIPMYLHHYYHHEIDHIKHLYDFRVSTYKIAPHTSFIRSNSYPSTYSHYPSHKEAIHALKLSKTQSFMKHTCFMQKYHLGKLTSWACSTSFLHAWKHLTSSLTIINSSELAKLSMLECCTQNLPSYLACYTSHFAKKTHILHVKYISNPSMPRSCKKKYV